MKYYSINVCTKCETELTLDQQFESNGTCPNCGHTIPGIYCQTKKLVKEVKPIKPIEPPIRIIREGFEWSNTEKWVLIAALFIALVFGAFFTGYAQTPEAVRTYCEEIGIKHPDIVTKQATLETGGFTCTECSLDHNNIFGFRYKKKYLIFDTWKQSCDYYLKWQSKYYKEQSNYYDFLNCIWVHSNGDCARYATDPEYTNKLNEL